MVPDLLLSRWAQIVMLRRIAILAICGVCVQAQPPVYRRPFRLDELRTPPGFEVTVFATLSGAPRLMAFGPNGVLYVALRDAGEIAAVPSANSSVVALRGLNGPHSVTFRGEDLYVAV